MSTVWCMEVQDRTSRWVRTSWVITTVHPSPTFAKMTCATFILINYGVIKTGYRKKQGRPLLVSEEIDLNNTDPTFRQVRGQTD